MTTERPKLTDPMVAYDVEKILERANTAVPQRILDAMDAEHAEPARPYVSAWAPGLPREVMEQLLSRLRYKPGTRMTLADRGELVFVLEVKCADSYHPDREIRVMHSYRVPPYIDTAEQFVAFVRQCLERVEVHEMQEWLKWVDSDLPIFDPHAQERR